MPISRSWKIAGATAAIVAFGAGASTADSGIHLQDRIDPVELQQVAASTSDGGLDAVGSPASPESADSPAESPAESADSPAQAPRPAAAPAVASADSPASPASAASADSPDSAGSDD